MAKMQNEPKFKDGWGDMIKEIREYRGYSQRYLAELVGVNQATVCKWEREISIPNVFIAKDLADALKVDIQTIFDI